MLTVYGYDRCSTCRNAYKWLESHGHQLDKRDITVTPPTEAELEAILIDGSYSMRDLFNTSGVAYRELNMKSKLSTMDQESCVSILSNNGRLVKRPIVTDGTHFTVGFKVADFEKTWG